MDVIPIEFNEGEPFCIWLERLRKSQGRCIIDGFAIINDYIALVDAIQISYCLN